MLVLDFCMSDMLTGPTSGPVSWDDMENITFSVYPTGIFFYLAPLYSDLGAVNPRQPGYISVPKDFVNPIPTVILPGTRMVGGLVWTARRRLGSSPVRHVSGIQSSLADLVRQMCTVWSREPETICLPLGGGYTNPKSLDYSRV